MIKITNDISSTQNQVNAPKNPVPPAANGNELTLKQRKWLQVYLETGNATEAAMQSYDCTDRDSAATIGWENLRKLDYPAFLEASGITDKLLANTMNEGLKSTKIVTSHTEPDREVSDMPTRHKYLETALKLKKRLVEHDVIVVSDKTLILDGTTDIPESDI